MASRPEMRKHLGGQHEHIRCIFVAVSGTKAQLDPSEQKPIR